MKLPTEDQCQEWFKKKCWNAYDRYGSKVVTLTQMIETFSNEHPGTEEWMKDRDHWIWKISLDVEEIRWLVKKGYLILENGENIGPLLPTKNQCRYD